MLNHMIWKMLQCAHILSLIMNFHNANVYCGVVLNVHISIFMTKKQIKNNKKQHPQLGFTFITLLDVVLLMVEYHWNTKICYMCKQESSLDKYTKIYTRKELVMMETKIYEFHTRYYIILPKTWPFTYPMCTYLVQITVVKCDTQTSNHVNYFKMYYFVVIMMRG